MPRVAPKKVDPRTADVRCLRATILGVNTNKANIVKKSISIPQAAYVWALQHAKNQGHHNVSRVVRDGIECLMRQHKKP